MTESIEQIAPADLVPYERNPRTHSDAQIQQLSGSIKQFGFTAPILIDENNGVLAGHGRLLAAKSIGLELVPCRRIQGLSDAQKKAYIIADNKLALNAGWDGDLLMQELTALHEVDFDMAPLGFDADELSMAMGLDEVVSESSAKEIDTDEYDMDHKCPKCGFEFDEKT